MLTLRVSKNLDLMQHLHSATSERFNNESCSTRGASQSDLLETRSFRK